MGQRLRLGVQNCTLSVRSSLLLVALGTHPKLILRWQNAGSTLVIYPLKQSRDTYTIIQQKLKYCTPCRHQDCLLP